MAHERPGNPNESESEVIPVLHSINRKLTMCIVVLWRAQRLSSRGEKSPETVVGIKITPLGPLWCCRLRQRILGNSQRMLWAGAMDGRHSAVLALITSGRHGTRGGKVRTLSRRPINGEMKRRCKVRRG